MTSRGKNAARGFESEIERSREDGNWKRALELAQQLKARMPQRESLSHFLIGEGKLEAYLDEWAPTKDNTERAQRELSDSRGYLTLATDEAGKKAGVALDAHLLLGKLNYACGAYEDALKHYKMAELDTLTEKDLPVRSLRIVAESYAIKGLCLELIAPAASSRYKQAERDAELVRSFELAADLTLLYLQRGGSSARAGPTLEAALARAPALGLGLTGATAGGGRLAAALERARDTLRAVEAPPTQTLRLTLARQLAELLMRGVVAREYRPPQPQAPEGPWKPKKYSALNQFVPANEWEEALLVLLVGEAMAARDAVLSQSVEFEAARSHALRNAIAGADLLALAAARWGQLTLVLEALERAMKFSYGCAHVWRQRALASAWTAGAGAGGAAGPGGAAGAGTRAAAVAARAAPLLPRDAPLRLVAANNCYQMGWIEEGIEHAEQALRIEDEDDGLMLARCCLYAGIGHQLRAQRTNSRIEKDEANETCLALLERAVRLDDNDHLAFYHLALQYLHLGRLNDAMDATRACLGARAESAGGLRLCAALWSCACAGARGARALGAARLARQHWPKADWPLAALARLQLAREGGDRALATGARLLRQLHEVDDGEDGPKYCDLDALSDSGPVVGGGGGGGGGGGTKAFSDAASSVTSAPRGGAGAGGGAGPGGAGARAQAWLALAELCVRLRRCGPAAGCVAEAAALAPGSPAVLLARGRVLAAGGEWAAARACYVDALALNPTHVDALVALGAAHYALGWPRLAEKVLREACALSPARAEPWRALAVVLAQLGDAAAAADAANAALQLQPTEPLLPLPL